ncbi:HET-domain-containing protein, partial [Glonium stellatum]
MGFLAPFQVANGAEFGPILTNGIQRSLNDHSTGSDAAIKLAKWWLERCRALHRTCRNFQDIPRLPDRVIDVGPPDGSQEPKLFETDGVERGDYLTLSHCWGKTRSFVTKTRTVNERIRGIPISTMPKTFSDAVLITRMFGVRFLWIDALCILQDSSWDWEVQAAEMAAIFRNSLFTISAANAADNDGGCFVTRDGRNVSNRAWILQEQILSPRTLVLDENHIHWRCCTSVASERHPGMKVIQNYDFILPSQASFRTVWHDVVENYTSRSLTKRTDKLAAIHGLATALGTAARFTYIAGLWKEHIQLDLVWRRRRSSIQRDDSVRSPTQEAGEHMLEIPAPSWSWASLDSPV